MTRSDGSLLYGLVAPKLGLVEQVPVGLEGQARRRVPEQSGDLVNRSALGDQQRGEGVAQVVGAAQKSDRLTRRAPDPVAPVGPVKVAGDRPLGALDGLQVVAQGEDQRHRARRSGLGALDRAVADGGPDDQARLAHVGPGEGDQLSRTKTGVGEQAHDGSVPRPLQECANPLDLGQSGRDDQARGLGQAPQPGARVRGEQSVLDGGTESRRQDRHGTVGGVGRLAIAPQVGSPVADVQAPDLEEAQLAQVGGDQPLGEVASVIPGPLDPARAVSSGPSDQPGVERHARCIHPSAARQVACEPLGLGLGGEAPGQSLASQEVVDAVGLAGAEGLVDVARHAPESTGRAASRAATSDAEAATSGENGLAMGWRIGDSNPWPPPCKGAKLASHAVPTRPDAPRDSAALEGSERNDASEGPGRLGQPVRHEVRQVAPHALALHEALTADLAARAVAWIGEAR